MYNKIAINNLDFNPLITNAAKADLFFRLFTYRQLKLTVIDEKTKVCLIKDKYRNTHLFPFASANGL